MKVAAITGAAKQVPGERLFAGVPGNVRTGPRFSKIGNAERVGSEGVYMAVVKQSHEAPPMPRRVM